MKNLIDLHMHSQVSDGEKTPTQLVAMAKEKNITYMSLTDHDSIAGCKEAMELGQQAGITVFSGIELSCYDKKDTHVLGYNIDCNNQRLVTRLDTLQKKRMERMKGMVEKLQTGGFDITFADVERHCHGHVMGRPHIGAVMVEKGYATDLREVFNKFIGAKCKYYVPYDKVDVKEGIDLIHHAGGVAVLAHPKLLRYNSRDFSVLLRGYKELGLDGIEVYYPCHYDEHIRLFTSLAHELDLLITCGGDYHNDHDIKKSTMGFDLDLPGLKETVEKLKG